MDLQNYRKGVAWWNNGEINKINKVAKR